MAEPDCQPTRLSAATALIAVTAIVAIRVAEPVVAPFLAALLLSYALEPMVAD